MTFLSVYTPTYKRPQALARCKASVAAQTIPTEHVIIVDEIGIGIDGMEVEIEYSYLHGNTSDNRNQDALH